MRQYAPWLFLNINPIIIISPNDISPDDIIEMIESTISDQYLHVPGRGNFDQLVYVSSPNFSTQVPIPPKPEALWQHLHIPDP